MKIRYLDFDDDSLIEEIECEAFHRCAGEKANVKGILSHVMKVETHGQEQDVWVCDVVMNNNRPGKRSFW